MKGAHSNHVSCIEVSVMPCRPEGHDKPQECCRFNVVEDEGEDKPEIIDGDACKGYQEEALSLYLGDSTTPKTSVAKSCNKPDGENWKYPTILRLPRME